MLAVGAFPVFVRFVEAVATRQSQRHRRRVNVIRPRAITELVDHPRDITGPIGALVQLRQKKYRPWMALRSHHAALAHLRRFFEPSGCAEGGGGRQQMDPHL
jgi:hypothetical protein